MPQPKESTGHSPKQRHVHVRRAEAVQVRGKQYSTEEMAHRTHYEESRGLRIQEKINKGSFLTSSAITRFRFCDWGKRRKERQISDTRKIQEWKEKGVRRGLRESGCY